MEKVRERSAMMGALVLWAGAFSVLRVGLEVVDPLTLTFLRFLISTLMFLPLMFKRKLSWGRKDLPTVFLMGTLGGVGYHVFTAYGEVYVTASVTAFIISLSPAFTALFASIFLKERVRAGVLVGIVSAIAGVALLVPVSTGNAEAGPDALRGLGLVFIASISWGLYTVVAKPVSGKWDSFSLVFALMLSSTVILLPFQMANHLAGNVHIEMGTRFLLSMLYLSLFSMVVPYILWHHALHGMEATEIASFLYIEPLLAASIGVLWLAEPFGPLQVVGGLLILCGVWLVNRGR